MYSRKIIENRIQSLPFEPKYYPHGYIETCVKHFDSLAIRDNKGRVTGTSRPLLPDEEQFIRNERALCTIDYLHWAENYHRIRDVETLAMIPFRQNKYQQVLTLAQAELEDAGKPVLIQLLKARQGGGTTDTTSKILQRALFVQNTAAIIASSDPEKSWKLSDMLTRSLPFQPWWLIPAGLKIYESGETYLDYARYTNRTSYISIQHGNQGTGIARGDTVNCYHLSEIPDYTNPELIIDASLFGAWHPTPMHFGVMESTAKGRKDYWHKRYLHNKEMWEKGVALERPLFLPYYISEDIYPTQGWLALAPVPESWEPPDHVKEHAERARDFVQSNPFLRQVMRPNWEMSIATQWWYSYTYDDHLRKDKLADFLSEYPSNDTEAFQSKSRSVFSIQLIQEYETKVPPPVGVFKLNGTAIPKRLIATQSEILTDEARIKIEWECEKEELSWILTPIKFPGYSAVNSHLDTLWVWEYPKEDESYCISLDAAEGIERDKTVLTVTRKGTVDRPSGQVASFASNTISGLEIWPIALLLLVYYSTWSSFKRDIQRPLFSPETKADGSSCLLEVRKRGWKRLYYRRDRAKKDQDTTLIAKLGWETNTNTRALLVQWLLTVVKGHYIEINSPWTIDEMRDFVAIENENTLKIKIEHDHNKFAHDDELFSLGIGIVTLHELDVYRGETPQWRAMTAKLAELVQFATFKEGSPELRFDPGDLSPKREQAKGALYPIKEGQLVEKS